MIEGVKKNTIYNDDAYSFIKKIDSNSVDLVVIDPPYKLSKGSGTKGYISKQKHKQSEELNTLRLDEGMDLEILDEFMRIMKKVNIYIWCNKAQIYDYLKFFVGIHKCSFDILVWIKTNPIPTHGRNYMNDKEFCLYFRKGITLQTTYQSGKTYWLTPTNVKDKRMYDHPTIKPLHIIETLIQNSSKENDLVLDCFLGSGTTVVAAKKLNRSYIGIEWNKKYYDTCMERIEQIHPSKNVKLS